MRTTTASAPSAPFFVPPKVRTSTPTFDPRSPTSTPSDTAALASRAPSRCRSMSLACAWSASSRISRASRPCRARWSSRSTRRACTWCGSPLPYDARSTSVGVKLPAERRDVDDLRPEELLGRPALVDVDMGRLAAMIASNERVNACSPITLAPVPLRATAPRPSRRSGGVPGGPPRPSSRRRRTGAPAPCRPPRRLRGTSGWAPKWLSLPKDFMVLLVSGSPHPAGPPPARAPGPPSAP